MSSRYRTQAVNTLGGTGRSWVPDGLSVDVANPLDAPADETSTTNPEQLLALAWSTCLNATAQAVVAGARRTAVRVEVELVDAEERQGYEFVATAFLSAEGLSGDELEALAAATHQRCPVSRLLHGAPTATVRTEPYADLG